MKQLHLLWLAAGLAGCAGNIPQVNTEQQIAQSVGVSNAIVFEVQGEPVDLSTPSPARLTMADAVRESLSHSPQLQQALARVRIALADAEQSRLLPNPVLNISVRLNEGGGSPTVEAGLAADLVAILQQPRRGSAADHRLRAASADAINSALDLLLETQQHFVEAQSLTATVELLERRQKVVARSLELAKARVEAGESPKADELALEAERVNVETDRMESLTALRNEKLALARLIGRPSSAIEWSIESWREQKTISLTESDCLSSAKDRPDVQSLRYELAGLGDDSALAKWWIGEGSVGIDAERDGGEWSVGPGASVPIPIFDTGQARRAKADAQLIEARHKLVAAERLAIAEVRQAYSTFQSSRETFEKIDRQLLPLMQKRHEQTRDQYQVGEADLSALLLAEQELQSAEIRRLNTERQLALSHLKLQRAVGGPIEKRNP